MDQSARRGFSKNAAYLTFPFVIAFSLFLPVFEWAALTLMFIPIVFLGAAVSRQNDLITHIKKNSQRVITTQETERNRIARDLHDHIGQVLTALTLRVAILRKQAPEELEKDLFWYIEVYYNRIRKHSANNWLTPEQKECNYYYENAA